MEKISKELGGELSRLGFVHEISLEDHPGCFGKSCEGKHLVAELRIWKPANPRYKWSFARETGGGFEYVLSQLPDLKPSF